ncbi:MAG: hypothetical protein RL596_2044 [Bacteroidota bacterium]|jgi:uncharacterized protein (TIGR04255 family)
MEDRQLSNNSIALFILRFDLQIDNKLDFDLLIGAIAKYFDRTEKRMQTNFEVKFTSDNSELNKVESFDYVLTSDKGRFSMTFSKMQNSFWFETTNYSNRETYSPIITNIINDAIGMGINMVARRIGMRFINNFNCNSAKNISKIFNPEISKNLTSRLKQEKISRYICQEEFNHDECKVRIQYGIPNKFYPAVLNNYDLLLDIDSYDDKTLELSSWIESISTLNHCAYNAFVSNINPLYINTLK